MAQKKCPKCGGKVPREAPRCPLCGEVFKSHGCAILMAIVIGLIAILFALLLFHKYKTRVAAGLFGFLSAPAVAWAQEEAPQKRYPAGVVEVSDGNTLVVRNSDFEERKLRLYGIDAPEGKQPGGREAKTALGALHGKTVEVTEMDVDHNGQTMALIGYEGRSVNLDLVAAGHARHYPQYCEEHPICGELEAAEGEAREERRGIWAGEPDEPWE